MGCWALLQGIFLIQGPNLLHLPHWQACSLPLAPPGELRGPHAAVISNQIWQTRITSQLWYRVRYCFRPFSVLCYIHGGSKANMDLTFILVVWWLSLLNEAFPLAFTRPLPSTPGSPKPHLTRPRHEARHVSKMQF